jgi:hypothetical protein
VRCVARERTEAASQRRSRSITNSAWTSCFYIDRVSQSLWWEKRAGGQSGAWAGSASDLAERERRGEWPRGVSACLFKCRKRITSRPHLPWWWRHWPQCCEGSRGAMLGTMTTRPGTCRGGAFACWHLAWPQPLIYRSRVRQPGHGKRLDGGRLKAGDGKPGPSYVTWRSRWRPTQRPNPPAAAPRGARLSALRGRHGRVGTDT